MGRWSILLPLIIFFLGTGVILFWLFHDPVADYIPSLPGMDHRGTGLKTAEEVKIGALFTFFRSSVEKTGTSWPRFRGRDFDNINKEPIKLIDSWGGKGPDILWKVELGEGHAAPAVYNGRVYVLDYDEKKREDALRCFSLTTGEELWRRAYGVRLKRNHGLSRTIPAVTDRYVVTIGPKCQVMCCDRINGDFLWGVDLVKEYGTEVPFWYTGQCPLIDNDTAIIAVGGRSLFIAVDCKTGKKVWETPNPRKWKMSHASVMPMTLNGKRSYVYFAVGGICGISASAPDRGAILWESTEFSPSVIAPSPVIFGNGYIFITAGYGAGSALLQVKSAGNSGPGRFAVSVLQKYRPSEGLASEQQTPVYLNGYLYGILPKDAGNLRNQFVVVKATECRNIITSSGKSDRYGLGPFIFADGKFFILNDDGEMTIATATPKEFKVLDRARIIDGQDSWGPVALTGGYMLIRDSKTMVCLNMKAR